MGAELDKRPWNAQQRHIAVHNGVVELWGFIFHETERKAIRVAVECVPDVKEVHDNMVWVEPLTGTPVDVGLAAVEASRQSPDMPSAD